MLAALDAGARRIVLCLGGSASTDGGAGMLAALGVRFLDGAGRAVDPAGGTLPRIAEVDAGALIGRRARAVPPHRHDDGAVDGCREPRRLGALRRRDA